VAAKKMTRILGFRSPDLATSASRPTFKQLAGFTLLEVLLVLAIMAMASIFVAPNLGGFEARTFSAQLRQANSLLNYARRTAVVSGQASSVSFNVIPVQELKQEQQQSLQENLNNIVAQWNSSDIELRFRDSTDREIDIEESMEVTFYPEGGSTGGALLFAQAEQRGIIDIDPFTGRISSPEQEQ
jgi:general secretion pathway protein H